MHHVAMTCDICGKPFASNYEMRRTQLDQIGHEVVWSLDLCASCFETKLAYLNRFPTKRPEPQVKVVIYPDGLPGLPRK